MQNSHPSQVAVFVVGSALGSANQSKSGQGSGVSEFRGHHLRILRADSYPVLAVRPIREDARDHTERAD